MNLRKIFLVLLLVLGVNCQRIKEVPVRPEPCKIWVLPDKPADPRIIQLEDGTGTLWVALDAATAQWVDTYLSSVEHQQELLKACPGVEFVTIGGGDTLKKLDWDKIGKDLVK